MKQIKSRTIIFFLSILLIVAVAITTPYTQNVFQWGAYVFLGVLAGISAISEIAEIFGLKKDAEATSSKTNRVEFGKNNPFQPKQSKHPSSITVAIWGPRASGKTWLWHAFVKTIANYNRPVNGLMYEIHESKINDFAFIEHSFSPTQNKDTSIFRFQRISASKSHREFLSSYSHKIFISDYAGGYFQGDLRNTNQEEHLLRNVFTETAFVDVILIALDSKFSGITKEEYPKLIRNFATALDKIEPNRKRLFAMCVTKADTIPAWIDANLDALIELKFGVEMLDVCSEIAQKHDVQIFITSAIGFLHDTNKSNCDPDKGTIIDVENWTPYGVEYPFFWVFETIEKRKIKENNHFGKFALKDYIEYPKP